MTSTASSEFVSKLFRILEEPENYPYVSWSLDGLSFVVSNQEGFSEFVLEKHFKHKNWSSFVRQLNKYDFYKIKTGREWKEDTEFHIWEYRNKYFQRDKPELLSKIRRKKAPSEKEPLLRNFRPKQIDRGVVCQTRVLNIVKEISRYLRIVTDDINEIKKHVYRGRENKREFNLRVNVLLVQEGPLRSLFIHDVLKHEECTLKIVNGSEDVENISFSKECHNVIILYAVSSRYGTIMERIRRACANIPIVLVMEENLGGTYADAFYTGATHILLMPFAKEELSSIIHMYRPMRT